MATIVQPNAANRRRGLLRPTAASVFAALSMALVASCGDADEPASSEASGTDGGDGAGLIAYWDACGVVGPLYVTSLDGAVRMTLPVSGPPAWSPDGAQVAVLDEPAESVRIVSVADAEVRDVTPLGRSLSESPLSESAMVDLVSWSPDGDQLAFYSRADGALWRVRSDGSDLRPVEVPAGNPVTKDHTVRAMRWLEDGRLVWAIYDPTSPGTVVVRAVGADESAPAELARVQLPVPATYVMSGGFDAAAEHLALSVSDESFDKWWIVMTDLLTGAAELQHESTADLAKVSFSPDGSRIAWMAYPPGSIDVLDRAGTSAETVAATGFSPVWMNDGRLLFTTVSALTVQDVISGATTTISTEDGVRVDCVMADQQPAASVE